MNRFLKISQWWKRHSKEVPAIKVIGVGCGGGNIVNHMHDLESNKIALVACDMDKATIDRSKASIVLQLGSNGLGAGNKPKIGRMEAEEKTKDIHELLLKNSPKATFVVTCLGGGCGTGAAPVIARESMKLGITTIGVATIPFEFEGKHKHEQALNGILELTNNCDALFLLNNQYILKHYNSLSMTEAFANADKLICEIIKNMIHSIT